MLGLIKGLFTKIIYSNNGLLYTLIEIVNYHILTFLVKHRWLYYHSPEREKLLIIHKINLNY